MKLTVTLSTPVNNDFREFYDITHFEVTEKGIEFNSLTSHYFINFDYIVMYCLT